MHIASANLETMSNRGTHHRGLPLALLAVHCTLVELRSEKYVSNICVHGHNNLLLSWLSIRSLDRLGTEEMSQIESVDRVLLAYTVPNQCRSSIHLLLAIEVRLLADHADAPCPVKL